MSNREGGGDVAGAASRDDQLDDRRLRRLLILEAVLALRAAIVLVLVVATLELTGTLWYAHAHRPHGGRALISRPRVGSVVAWLDIPRLGVHEPIIEGEGRAQLRHGVGHVPHTALPGVTGPGLLVGHSAMFGGPFGHISQLVIGDAVNVSVGSSLVLHYTVAQRARPVAKTSVVATNPDLVLITGTPRFVPSRAIALVAKPLNGPAEASGPGVPLDHLIDQAAVLRPWRPAQVASLLAGLAVLGCWELFRTARRRNAGRARLLATAAAGAVLILVLLVAVASAFPALF